MAFVIFFVNFDVLQFWEKIDSEKHGTNDETQENDGIDDEINLQTDVEINRQILSKNYNKLYPHLMKYFENAELFKTALKLAIKFKNTTAVNQFLQNLATLEVQAHTKTYQSAFEAILNPKSVLLPKMYNKIMQSLCRLIKSADNEYQKIEEMKQAGTKQVVKNYSEHGKGKITGVKPANFGVVSSLHQAMMQKLHTIMRKSEFNVDRFFGCLVIAYHETRPETGRNEKTQPNTIGTLLILELVLVMLQTETRTLYEMTVCWKLVRQMVVQEVCSHPSRAKEIILKMELCAQELLSRLGTFNQVPVIIEKIESDINKNDSETDNAEMGTEISSEFGTKTGTDIDTEIRYEVMKCYNISSTEALISVKNQIVVNYSVYILTPLYDIIQQIDCEPEKSIDNDFESLDDKQIQINRNTDNLAVYSEVTDCLHQLIESQFKTIGPAWSVIFQTLTQIADCIKFSNVEHIYRLFTRYIIEEHSLVNYGILNCITSLKECLSLSKETDETQTILSVFEDVALCAFGIGKRNSKIIFEIKQEYANGEILFFNSDIPANLSLVLYIVETLLSNSTCTETINLGFKILSMFDTLNMGMENCLVVEFLKVSFLPMCFKFITLFEQNDCYLYRLSSVSQGLNNFTGILNGLKEVKVREEIGESSTESEKFIHNSTHNPRNQQFSTTDSTTEAINKVNQDFLELMKRGLLSTQLDVSRMSQLYLKRSLSADVKTKSCLIPAGNLFTLLTETIPELTEPLMKLMKSLEPGKQLCLRRVPSKVMRQSKLTALVQEVLMLQEYWYGQDHRVVREN